MTKKKKNVFSNNEFFNLKRFQSLLLNGVTNFI